MPLNRAYERDRRFSPFMVTIRPIHDFREQTHYYREEAYTRTHHVRTQKSDYIKACGEGVDYADTGDYFEKWYKKLGMKDTKRIVPLSYDWPFVSAFIRKWIGNDTFEETFDYRHRDILSMCGAENDVAFFNFQDVPFAKLDFSYIASRLGMPTASLQLPVGERALILGQMYMTYHLKRNSWNR